MSNVSLAVLKQKLQAGALSKAELEALQTDPRTGAKTLWQQYQRKQKRLASERAAFKARCQLEQAFWDKGQLVAGVDEVGRGPLAGPVLTCAVVLPPDFDIYEVNDSKQLSDHKRRELYPQILGAAESVSIGYADNRLIDQRNIYQATRIAMAEAVSGLSVKPAALLVDAMDVPVPLPQQKLTHGDARSISIGAASIVAKVVRDNLMAMYDRVYPGYDFKKNKGYGTKKHLAGLAKLGPCPIHRFSFTPVKNYQK